MYQQKEESSSGTADPLGLSILKDSTVAQKTHSPLRLHDEVLSALYEEIFSMPKSLFFKE